MRASADRGIFNPIRTGFIKGLTQVADFIAEPMPELVNGKYTDDYDKNYQEHKNKEKKKSAGKTLN